MSLDHTQQPISKKSSGPKSNLKTKQKTMHQELVCLKEIQHIALMHEMMNPLKKIYTNRLNNHKLIEQAQNHGCGPALIYQALNLDATSYQTLKTLIIEHKSLAQESQSSQFVIKQSQKLFNFIDGWTKLQNCEYREEDYMNWKQISNTSAKKQRSTSKSKSEIAHQEENTQKLRQNLRQESMTRDEGVRQIKRIEQNMENRKLQKRLSTNPPLIIEEKQYYEKKETPMQIEDSDQQLEIQIEIETNQNDINNSNINVSNIKVNHSQNPIVKVQQRKPIKISQKVILQEKNKSIKLYQNSKIHNKTDQAEKRLSEIVRPEYQKTQASFEQSTESLAQSQQLQNSIDMNTNRNAKNGNKKVIPLLKKNPKLSVKYNQHIQQSRSKRIPQNANISVSLEANTQRQQQNQAIIQKGFVTEDTDANSQLSIFANNQVPSKSKQRTSDRRSVSPKIEGKRKTVIKLSSGNQTVETKKNQQQDTFKTITQSSNPKNRLEQITSSKNASSTSSQNHLKNVEHMNQLRMQKELKQLEDQFSNRNSQRAEKLRPKRNAKQQVKQQVQSVQQPFETNYHKQNAVPITQTDQLDERNQLAKPTPKHLKALDLIRKSSNESQKKSQQGQVTDGSKTNVGKTAFSHCPLTSKINNFTQGQNSIVPEEDPWECDEEELEQQLKAIDEKIQDRKSILTKQFHSRQKIYEETHLHEQPNYFKSGLYEQNKFNSTQPIESTKNNSKEFHHHKRSNTNFHQEQYSENLFQEFIEPSHEEDDQENSHNQPKVVRLSLTALAHQAHRKSSKSVTAHQNNDKKSLNKNYSKDRLQGPQFPKDFHLNDLEAEKACIMQRDSSSNRLYKEPSCRSILLMEEAEKRGISPCKSNKSLKSNNKNVSPIKMYVQGNKVSDKKSLTPRNTQGAKLLSKDMSRKQMQIPQIKLESESVYPTNSRRNKTPTSNRNDRQIRNLSPIGRNNAYSNTFVAYEVQNNTPKDFSSNSRTLSDKIDSQFSREKTQNYPIYLEKNFIDQIHRQGFYGEFDQEEIYGQKQNHRGQNHNPMEPVKKWNENRKNQNCAAGHQAISVPTQFQKKKKIILLTDQIANN